MKTKVCGRCGKRKPVGKFAWKSQAKGVRSSNCKSCHASYSREHYKSHRQKYLDKASKRNSRIRSEVRDWIQRFLRSSHCIDCGETDPIVLDFDHRGNKDFCISHHARRNVSLDRVKKEASKCDVRCANCHRRKHVKEKRAGVA